jgi:hypothetical protein
VNVNVSEVRPGGWAAAGPGGGDIAYRTQSLKFSPVETSLDESVSLRTLLTLFVSAAVVSFTVWVIFALSAFIVLLSSINSFASSYYYSSSSGSDNSGLVAVLFMIGQILPFIFFWVVLLTPQIDEPIAEWRTLLEGKAPAAASAYAVIYGSLARRQVPVHATALRIRSDVLTREVVNNRLVISERSYVVYVSVFPYGTSLYVGWSMYRSRRGAVLIGIFLKDLVGSFVGRTGLVNQMLRTEKVRAMREAVHSAVREGVDAAVAGIEVPIAATFGYEVPVQDLTTVGAVPAAGGWQPGLRPSAPEAPQSPPPVPPQPRPAGPWQPGGWQPGLRLPAPEAPPPPEQPTPPHPPAAS